MLGLRFNLFVHEAQKILFLVAPVFFLLCPLFVSHFCFSFGQEFRTGGFHDSWNNSSRDPITFWEWWWNLNTMSFQRWLDIPITIWEYNWMPRDVLFLNPRTETLRHFKLRCFGYSGLLVRIPRWMMWSQSKTTMKGRQGGSVKFQDHWRINSWPNILVDLDCRSR